jgi:hypothetical protein
MKMTAFKTFTIVAALLAGGTLALAQNGPPTGGQRPVAGGANGGGWGGGWYAGGAYGYPGYGYGYWPAYGYNYNYFVPYRYWSARRLYYYRGVGFY